MQVSISIFTLVWLCSCCMSSQMKFIVRYSVYLHPILFYMILHNQLFQNDLVMAKIISQISYTAKLTILVVILFSLIQHYILLASDQ
jgi:hypothetical protein